MKKFLILVLSLCLVACGDSSATSKKITEDNTTKEVNTKNLNAHEIEEKLLQLQTTKIFASDNIEEVANALLSIFDKDDYYYDGSSEDKITQLENQYTIAKDLYFRVIKNDNNIEILFHLAKNIGTDYISAEITFSNFQENKEEYRNIFKDILAKLVVDTKQEEILEALNQVTSLDYLLSYGTSDDFTIHLNSMKSTPISLDELTIDLLTKYSFHAPEYMNQLIHYQTTSSNPGKVLTNHFHNIHTVLQIPSDQLSTTYLHTHILEQAFEDNDPRNYFAAIERFSVVSRLNDEFGSNFILAEDSYSSTTQFTYPFSVTTEQDTVLNQINQIITSYTPDIQVNDLSDKEYKGKNAKVEISTVLDDISLKITPNETVLNFPKVK